MNQINYLESNRKKHLKNHFELRGSPELGYSWWLVFDRTDSPPEFVGSESRLPGYARDQLARLRADPEIGDRRKARFIPAHRMFFPGQDADGIPHVQNVEWLRQYQHAISFYSAEKGYLVVLIGPHNEDYPLEIWESHGSAVIDELESSYRLVWKRPKEED